MIYSIAAFACWALIGVTHQDNIFRPLLAAIGVITAVLFVASIAARSQ